MPSPDSEQPGEPEVGRTIPLSLPRRIMSDVLAFAKRVPSVPVQRQMNVSRALAARADQGPERVGWCAVFTKAYALTAARFPELRRAYLSFPRPRLYEHPHSVASIAVERDYQGEKAVFWGHVSRPERMALSDLQGYLRRFAEAPLESIPLCRRALRMGRLPWPARRLALWVGLNVFGAQRAKRLGTFGVSVYSGLGAESLHPISPLTGTLTYGPIRPDGAVSVRLVYDHRVLDGATVARALAALEGALNGEIAAELEQLARGRAA